MDGDFYRGKGDGTRQEERRISDGRILKLIKQWLEASVEETDDKDRKTQTTRNKDEHRGTPQGGVASPLLANLYMRRFVLGWKTGGHEQPLDARIVNYADDFVICTRRGRGPAVKATMQDMMDRLRLRVKTSKRGGRQSYPDMQFYEKYGMLNLTKSVRRHSLWATGAS
jgi:Reverse transcriptase (RNA-dependent DNA polymerase)